MRLNREVGKLLKGIILPWPGEECNDLMEDESSAWWRKAGDAGACAHVHGWLGA